jgi:hypothetical protein
MMTEREHRILATALRNYARELENDFYNRPDGDRLDLDMALLMAEEAEDALSRFRSAHQRQVEQLRRAHLLLKEI